MIDRDEVMSENSYIKTTLKDGNPGQYRTLLIGVGDAGNSIMEQMKNQNAGARKYCSADQQSLNDISKALIDTDLAILLCGFDTDLSMYEIGSIALRAKRMGVLTLGITMTPPESEGEDLTKAVRETINDISDVMDALVVISNKRVRSVSGNENLNTDELRLKTEETFRSISRSIMQMIGDMEAINTEPDDIRSIINNKGIMYYGTGEAEGGFKAELAIEQAMRNSYVESTLSEAYSVILNVSGSISPIDSVVIMEILQKKIGANADVLYTLNVDKTMGDTIRVSVLAAA